MCGQCLPHDRAVAGDQIEEARGCADALEDLGEDEGVEGCNLTRLEDDGAAGGKRRRDLGRDLVQRVIPRRDRPHHADRLANDQRVAERGLPLEVGSHLCHRVERPRGQAHLDQLGEGARHPHLVGDQVRELFATLAEGSTDGGQQRDPLGDGGGGPGRKGIPCSPDRVVDIGRRSLGNGAEHFLGRGIDHLDGAGAGPGKPGSSDVELVSCGGRRCRHDAPSSASLRDVPVGCGARGFFRPL